MKGIILRPLLFLLLCGSLFPIRAQQPPPVAPLPDTYAISGTVHSGKTLMPGVTVTASNTLTGKKFSVATSLTGSYSLAGLPRGRYVVRVEFLAFAPQTQEILLNAQKPAAILEFDIQLASRLQQQQSDSPSSFASSRGFQSLGLDGASSNNGENASLGGLNGASAGNPSDSAVLPMNGAGADSATESVSVSGAMGRTQDFGNGSEDDIQQRIQEFRDRAQREGGGFGGGPGGSGGGGGPFALRLPRGFNINQPHGTLFLNIGDSAFDARPFSLDGTPQAKASYDQLRFGAFVGGPLKIPKLWDGSKKNFFFLGWTGTRGSNPFDSVSTVPTGLERLGNFAGLTDNKGNPIQLYDPQTGLPIANNQLTAISPEAQYLLQFIPHQNQPGSIQNFHYVTSADSNSDALSFRLVHNFGTGGGPGGMPFGGGGGGGGGRGGGNRPQNNLNIALNYSRAASQIPGAFPTVAGNSNTQGFNGSAGYTYGKGKLTNNLRFNYNHNRTATSNLYSGVLNVAGAAGINGVSTSPFDWNIPITSFTSFTGLNSPSQLRQLAQTYTISDTIAWNHGKHNWRFGGDYRRIMQDYQAARNGAGSFTFTGFATAHYDSNGNALPGTGSDFADFLLGLPAQTTIQAGPNEYNFRANSYDFFAQNDWRIRSNVTLNLGLRYEYASPFSETQNRIVNLDVNSDFTAAVPVLPNQSGPFTGPFSVGLISPDRNNWAPRVAIAWKPQKQTVVRTGYGINYNLAQYGNIIQNFAFQPPFALTQTNSSVLSNPLTLANGFPPPTAAVTNNFAVDKNYNLGYVQIWNFDIQRTLPHGILLNIGYNGAKGTHLDMQRAPNRNPDGTLRIPGVQPFLFESSVADSILNALSIRARKRLQGGFSVSGTYVYSKSLDNASSIGGGAVVVAQNDQDLRAEWGPSSFDQRQRFTGNWILELPFGPEKRYIRKGAASHIMNGWQWSGDFTLGTGLPNTVRVLGNPSDITTGANGSLRADLVPGQLVYSSNPTVQQWFNTAAFVVPPAGTFGDSERNMLYGPGQVALDMAISKTITIKESRALELRLQATNVFNIVEFTSINTIVNSQTFGAVAAAGSMRRLTIVSRFRF